MGRSQVALVVHFHQPVGNLDSVVEGATGRCYRPFLETLDRFPRVKMTLHYSGCLLEWLEAHATDVTDRLRALVARGQVELMTGGFYEPVLAALPPVDRVGQIRMLTAHLAESYGARTSGLWLTERVWEQDVVASLVDAGVRYTILDDTTFHSVGITDEELTGPYVTDYDGRPLLVYAGDRRLRYLIPYKRVERVVDYLRSGDAGRLFVYADDGEKLGEWPDTYERVYENKWLETFFTALEAHADDFDLLTLGDHAVAAQPRGRVYLPSSSYDEMMTWALPTEARLTEGKLRRALTKDDRQGALPFVKGAPWRAFLAKYPEVNDLQKRMLHVSRLLHDNGASDEAWRELYRAQCNCAYWHGAFGGVYLSFMRGALWHHLMRAEALARPASGIEVVDLDADARPEILLRAQWGAALLAPHLGGRLIELDDYRVGANLLSVMARHREAYHLEDENPPEEGDDEGDMQAIQAHAEIGADELTFDETGRGALIDLVNGQRVEAPYEYAIDDDAVRLWTERDGLRIEKAVVAAADGLAVAHSFTNVSRRPFTGAVGTQSFVLPLNLGRDAAPDDVDVTSDSWTVLQAEGEVGLEVALTEPGKVAAVPVETASATLEGLQKMQQGTEVTTEWPVELAPGESFSVGQRWRILINDAAHRKRDKGVSA